LASKREGSKRYNILLIRKNRHTCSIRRKKRKSNGRSDLTNSGEIQQLEELLRKKREEKELMDRKYRPLIEDVTKAIDKDSLNYELVLELLSAHYEASRK
jgi:hypothetical protein